MSEKTSPPQAVPAPKPAPREAETSATVADKLARFMELMDKELAR